MTLLTFFHDHLIRGSRGRAARASIWHRAGDRWPRRARPRRTRPTGMYWRPELSLLPQLAPALQPNAEKLTSTRAESGASCAVATTMSGAWRSEDLLEGPALGPPRRRARGGDDSLRADENRLRSRARFPRPAPSATRERVTAGAERGDPAMASSSEGTRAGRRRAHDERVEARPPKPASGRACCRGRRRYQAGEGDRPDPAP